MEPTPRAIDLAEYVKQKDASNGKIELTPIVNPSFPICQKPEQVQAQAPLIAKARREIAEIMVKYNIWRIEAYLGSVQVE